MEMILDYEEVLELIKEALRARGNLVQVNSMSIRQNHKTGKLRVVLKFS